MIKSVWQYKIMLDNIIQGDYWYVHMNRVNSNYYNKEVWQMKRIRMRQNESKEDQTTWDNAQIYTSVQDSGRGMTTSIKRGLWMVSM